ncbi:hypothetical protein [Ancylobacter oerskovii]|uniref:Uncharacterized protein n=1 Tax=Ancylobacter oerskovii TaxID=459519 RepID=A0ABW4Z5D1_9HYPH|nr:hypothetical protein [Ancylobacter oerskovii]MBS7545552.1 hypothetical protein [Ancylobacter oerskovii]
MSKVTFNFRVEEALKADFIKKAKENNRNASILLRDFMQEYANPAPGTVPQPPDPNTQGRKAAQ